MLQTNVEIASKLMQEKNSLEKTLERLKTALDKLLPENDGLGPDQPSVIVIYTEDWTQLSNIKDPSFVKMALCFRIDEIEARIKEIDRIIESF